MDSLCEIQFKAESFMQEHLETKRKSLWDKLVESSVKYHGGGCDGILMGKVEKYTEKLLSELTYKQMNEIWQETENGIMAIKQGFNKPDT